MKVKWIIAPITAAPLPAAPMPAVLMMVLLAAALAACSRSPIPTPEAGASPTPTSVPSSSPTPSPEAGVSPTPTPAPSGTLARAPDAPARADAHAQAERLGCGVNLGNALEAPREGEWGVVLQEEYFVLIREAGFDTVRVPIRWSAHAAQQAPYTIDEAFFERVDWVVDHALAQGLNVAINMHHYDEIFAEPDGHRERFWAMWRQIAARYAARCGDQPERLYLEPLNEPHDRLTPRKWNDLLAETIAVIREEDAVHTLIVGGGEWNGVQALDQLRIPAGEQNVVCTFHFYEPFMFTHQGAEWVGPEFSTTGIIWPGPPDRPLEPNAAAARTGWTKDWFRQYSTLPAAENPSGPGPVLQAMDQAARWMKQTGRPLWLGEFGAYSTADMASRARWTAFVRQEAEKRGISWAYWEFCAGFGLYDPAARAWREELLAALIEG
jgi:endoglucanase